MNPAYKWLAVAVIVGLTAYYFIPQLGELDDIGQSLQQINAGWLMAALVASMATYGMATLTVIGSTKRHINWGQAFVVQVASTVLNRITPKGIGTAVITERYLEKQGCNRAEAIAAVSIIYAAGALTHGVLLVGIVLIERPALQDLLSFSTQQVILVVGVVLACLVVVVVVPQLYRPLIKWGRELRQGLRYSATRPLKLLQLFGGSAGTTLCFALALYCSMAGLGVAVSFGAIVLIYLGSGVVALASPAPGGLGATEAALALGLSAVGVPASLAITGVLLYRLVSFWFPILPGLVALRYVTKRKLI